MGSPLRILTIVQQVSARPVVAPYGGYRSTANRPINIYLTVVQRAHTWVRPYGVVRNCNSSINVYLTVVPKENGLPHQCAHWFAMTDLIQQTTDR